MVPRLVTDPSTSPAASSAPAGGEWRGHVALLGVQLSFGLFPLFGKFAFETFSPGLVAAYRILFGAGLFLGLAFWLHGRAALPARRDLIRFQLAALLGVAVNQVLYLEGLKRSTAINAGLMMLMIPVFTFLIAVLVRQERFAPRRALGIAIALIGTGGLLFAREPDLSRPYLVGNLLMVGNTLCYSIFLVWSRPLVRRYPPLVAMAWVFALSVWTIPLFLRAPEVLPSHADADAWWSLAAILVFPTALGYLLNLVALRFVQASTTAVYVLLQPLITGVGAWLWLSEPLRTSVAVAAAFIFAGIWLVIAPRRFLLWARRAGSA